MRVSVDDGDPGYAPMLIGGIKVFFDGSECKGFTADEEKQLVVVPVLDDKDNITLDGEDNVVCETLYGDVRIECDPVALVEHTLWLRPETRASAVVAHYSRLRGELAP